MAESETSSRVTEERPASAAGSGRERLASGPALVGYVALAKLALHLVTAATYGFFIDELYFLACGEHLAWGYVDFPPLTAFQAWLTRHLFGDSPYSIRLFPALAGAGLVLITGALARRLGGRRFAQALAAVCVLVAPSFLAFSTYLSMNPVEALIWAGCALVVLRMIQTGDTRLWVAFGLLAGLGLLNKHTMLALRFRAGGRPAAHARAAVARQPMAARRRRDRARHRPAQPRLGDPARLPARRSCSPTSDGTGATSTSASCPSGSSSSCS